MTHAPGAYRPSMDQSSALTEPQHDSVTFPEGLTLDCGRHLETLTVAYRCYGTLNAARAQRYHDLPRSNRRSVCRRAESGDRQARLVGACGRAGRPVDTDKFFVICANVLGGCMGSTGPRSPRDGNPAEPWGTDFPPVTIHDMVRAQKRLVDHLGIEKLFAVVGGSMGGMQALSWAAQYPAVGVRLRAGGDRALSFRAKHRLP